MRRTGPQRLELHCGPPPADDRPDQARVPQLWIALLGGFRAHRCDAAPVSGWQRRSAKTLTKLVAVAPGHAIHRDQVIEVLWPDLDVDAALNSFAKALHAARRAFEPELPPRGRSAYLRLTEGVLALDPEYVVVDADRFERLAHSAFRTEEINAYETALSAYGGELLPEDRYEDWSAERRDSLAALYVELLLGLAHALETGGAWSRAAELLRAVLRHDPTREDVHRELMRLYAENGNRHQALRQFEICRERLRREQDVRPARETMTLYADVLADRVKRRAATPDRSPAGTAVRRPAGAEAPFVGRETTLEHMHEELDRAEAGNGGMLLVAGEPGVGKSRLVAEFAAAAERRGACVLDGGGGTHVSHPGYGPFSVALERYAAALPPFERRELGRRHPALARFTPSLETVDQPPRGVRPGPNDHLDGRSAIVRLLSELAGTRPVVVVVGDVQDGDATTVDLLQYVAQLALQRRWLILGAIHEGRLDAQSELGRRIDAMVRERICASIELQCLHREACDDLVCALLGGVRPEEATLDRLFALSLGNPLFVEELVRELQREDAAAGLGSRHLRVSPAAGAPAGVRARVRMHIAPFGEPVRRALALVAAAGAEISLGELRAAVDALRPPLSDATLFDALDTALRAGILEERGDGYAFRHPLVGAALYDELSRHRRDELLVALGRSAAWAAPPRLEAAAG